MMEEYFSTRVNNFTDDVFEIDLYDAQGTPQSKLYLSDLEMRDLIKYAVDCL